jgi:hypothetical protein
VRVSIISQCVNKTVAQDEVETAALGICTGWDELGKTNLVGNSAEHELGRAEAVGDFFKAIAQTMSEIVGGINLPLIPCPVMRLVENAVCGEIPHLGVSIGDILLHAQEGFAWLVLSIAHGAEFLEVVFRRLLCMLAPETRACSLFASTLELYLVIYTISVKNEQIRFVLWN